MRLLCITLISTLLSATASADPGEEISKAAAQSSTLITKVRNLAPLAPSIKIDPKQECPVRENYLRRALTQELLPLPEFAVKLMKNNPQVVFFGENHRFRPVEAMMSLADLIQQQDSEYDCLVLEKDFRCQSDLDDIMHGRRSFEDVSQSASKRCYFDSEKDELLLERAHGLGLKVFAVDDLTIGFDEDGNPTRSVAESTPFRDESITKRTASLLHRGVCKKVIANLGYGHTIRALYDEETASLWDSVPHRLRQLGYTTSTILFLNRANYRRDVYNEFAPKECSWNLWNQLTPPTISAFLPQSPAPPSLYARYPWGNPRTLPTDYNHPVRWDDYQGVVVIP